MGVSVSRADDGTPVTGLAVENFRVAAQLGALFGDVPDFAVDQVTEWQWEPDDVEKSGCYELRIGWQPIRLQVRGQPPPPPSGRLVPDRVALRPRDPSAHLRQPDAASRRRPGPDDRGADQHRDVDRHGPRPTLCDRRALSTGTYDRPPTMGMSRRLERGRCRRLSSPACESGMPRTCR